MGSRPGHYDPPGGNGGGGIKDTPSTSTGAGAGSGATGPPGRNYPSSSGSSGRSYRGPRAQGGRVSLSQGGLASLWT